MTEIERLRALRGAVAAYFASPDVGTWQAHQRLARAWADSHALPAPTLRDAKDWEPVCAERAVIREGRRDEWSVYCTRRKGHTGDHVARDETREALRWPQDVTAHNAHAGMCADEEGG